MSGSRSRLSLGLGDRLKLWIDHHTHERHGDYIEDARFVLVPRAAHPGCPELVTPSAAQAGSVDTIVCHSDFDGIAPAAKFLTGASSPTLAATPTPAPSTRGRRGERTRRAPRSCLGCTSR